jgi:hypothetical protein
MYNFEVQFDPLIIKGQKMASLSAHFFQFRGQRQDKVDRIGCLAKGQN